MEPHKNLSGIEEFRPSLKETPQEYFDKAHKFALAYYAEQMRAIASVKFGEVTPEFFFRELIWVVHATGFSAKAVGKFMPRLVQAYGHWDSLGHEDYYKSFERVKLVCNNPQKAKAVHTTAKMMSHDLDDGLWTDFKREKLSTPELLAKLPYIGKVTCYHLGRNIGLLECVKPDLHLIRMAKNWGFQNCEEMCKSVRPNGMPLGIVDLILWYSASTWGTLEIKKEGVR